MTEPLRIRIRSDWDAALTYDSLNEPPETRAVFVGRDTLIAPLVAEIAEPNKRGTYLISGYRGTGKTTLLIEALSRAQGQLAKREHKLFPLVLNVSEVSASLGTTTSPGSTASAESEQLDINPNRLLIALLRSIDHRLRRQCGLTPNDPELKELARKARFAYEKATATKFSQTANQSQERKLNRSLEFALALEGKNVLKTLPWLAGSAAIAIEAVALIRPTLGGLHAAAVALAGVFLVSVTAAYKRSKSDSQTTTQQTAFEYDNSLQQLETDLKDLLVSLKDFKMRTVVVIEELDKIQDDGETQLDRVIRYFKNLFTQAPALFFFVTDKKYFDIIASAIKRARRARSYAVEHTFFTHRLFVGRPTTEESLKFIAAIMVDEADRNRVTAVAETLGKPGRIDEADQFGRFVRCLLFYAANHLFDLKNELRRFVRNEEQVQDDGSRLRLSSFLIDDQTLPPEEVALAVFQDLIVEKSRSFEIKGGRAYANETLADSLYAVFNELGSSEPQDVKSFMAFGAVHRPDRSTIEEQLARNEAGRVREAVRSLIGDLERGRALTRDVKGETFTWREDAARAFRYVRQLEKHEESLVAELQRHAALATPLVAMLPPPAGPNTLAQELEKRVADVREAREPMSADAAAEELRGLSDSYAATLTSAFSGPLDELQKVGFVLEPVARGLAGSLYFVKPSSGDPRLRSTSPPRGGVLLAFGETETLLDDVWSFMRPPEGSPPIGSLDRAALVHVIHTTGSIATEVESRREQWNQSLKTRAGTNSDFRYAVDVVALIDPDRDPNLSCVQRIAGSITGFGAWSRPAQRPYESLPESPLLVEPLKTWIDSKALLLHLVLSGEITNRVFGERDEIERDGRAVLSLWSVQRLDSESLFARIAGDCLLKGFDQSVVNLELRAKIGRWLLSEGRVVLFVRSNFMADWSLADISEALKAGARVIFLSPDPSLPDELRTFSHTTFLPPAEP